jgi:hypothetical protein
MIGTWLHHKIKNKTLAQSYKFQISPTMKILSTNNPKRGLELKVLESQAQCSKTHQRFHQISTAVQGRFNTCLLNNLLVFKIHVEIGILYRILYLPFTKFWFLKF